MNWRDRFDLAQLQPFWHRATVWWSARSLREQVMLAALAALGIFALLLVVLAPLREARIDALSDIRNASLLEVRLRDGGQDLVGRGKFLTGTSSAIITNTAAAARLEIQETRPEGDNVRVILTDAPFNTVLTWVADVENRSNLRVRNANIVRQGASGFVSVTLVFGQ